MLRSQIMKKKDIITSTKPRIKREATLMKVVVVLNSSLNMDKNKHIKYEISTERMCPIWTQYIHIKKWLL